MNESEATTLDRAYRQAQAASLVERVAPWADHVSGADPGRFPTLLAGRARVDINAPLALVETEVAAQLRLLDRLRAAGLLVEPEAAEACTETLAFSRIVRDLARRLPSSSVASAVQFFDRTWTAGRSEVGP